MGRFHGRCRSRIVQPWQPIDECFQHSRGSTSRRRMWPPMPLFDWQRGFDGRKPEVQHSNGWVSYLRCTVSCSCATKQLASDVCSSSYGAFSSLAQRNLGMHPCERTSSCVSFGVDPGLVSMHAPACQRDGSAAGCYNLYLRSPAKRGSLVACPGRSFSLSAWTTARAGGQSRGVGGREKGYTGWAAHEFHGRTQNRKEEAAGGAAKTAQTARTPSAFAGTLVTARGEAAREPRAAATFGAAHVFRRIEAIRCCNA